jgi:hypothetical protein
MAWQVMGTREKRYRVDTPRQVAAWVADEIETIGSGWLPMSSGRDPDGSLRVLYGGLPPELVEPDPDGTFGPGGTGGARDPILHTPAAAGQGAVLLAILSLCLFLATFAMFLRP